MSAGLPSDGPGLGPGRPSMSRLICLTIFSAAFPARKWLMQLVAYLLSFNGGPRVSAVVCTFADDTGNQ